jgi:hypothetical protein
MSSVLTFQVDAEFIDKGLDKQMQPEKWNKVIAVHYMSARKGETDQYQLAQEIESCYFW